MTVTGADISLSASHTAKQTYRREESLLVGFVSGEEGFSEETIDSGRRITRVQEQSEAFSGDTLLDRFQRGDNLTATADTRTEYLSSLRALQADFTAEARAVSDSTLLPSAASGSDAVESVVDPVHHPGGRRPLRPLGGRRQVDRPGLGVGHELLEVEELPVG